LSRTRHTDRPVFHQTPGPGPGTLPGPSSSYLSAGRRRPVLRAAMLFSCFGGNPEIRWTSKCGSFMVSLWDFLNACAKLFGDEKLSEMDRISMGYRLASNQSQRISLICAWGCDCFLAACAGLQHFHWKGGMFRMARETSQELCLKVKTRMF
jgi:hypothetical protein